MGTPESIALTVSVVDSEVAVGKTIVLDEYPLPPGQQWIATGYWTAEVVELNEDEGLATVRIIDGPASYQNRTDPLPYQPKVRGRGQRNTAEPVEQGGTITVPYGYIGGTKEYNDYRIEAYDLAVKRQRAERERRVREAEELEERCIALGLEVERDDDKVTVLTEARDIADLIQGRAIR